MKINAGRPIILGFVLRVIVAIWNGLFGPSYGASADAYVFDGSNPDRLSINRLIARKP